MSANHPDIPLYKIKTKDMDPLGFDIIDLSGKGGKIYDSNAPHRHTFFELIFFTSGLGTHEIDFYFYPVESGSVHFVCPGQIHQLSLNNTKGYVLCFTEDFVPLKAKASFTGEFPFFDNASAPFLKLEKTLSEEITLLIELLARERRSHTAESNDLCHAYLNIILLKIKSFFLDDKKNNLPGQQQKKQKVFSYKKLINKHYLLHQPVSHYASDLNISPNHLNALCKKHEGRTASQLIQERLLLESKRLLHATDMDVKQISFYLKFEDVPYFNRFFKKQTGFTPMQYREQSRKNH